MIPVPEECKACLDLCHCWTAENRLRILQDVCIPLACRLLLILSMSICQMPNSQEQAIVTWPIRGRIGGLGNHPYYHLRSGSGHPLNCANKMQFSKFSETSGAIGTIRWTNLKPMITSLRATNFKKYTSVFQNPKIYSWIWLIFFGGGIPIHFEIVWSLIQVTNRSALNRLKGKRMHFK